MLAIRCLQSPACQLTRKLHKAYQSIRLFHHVRRAKSDPNREPIEGTDGLHARLDFTQVDRLSQELDLARLIGFDYVGVPGSRPPVGAITPPVPSLFQVILQLEG